MFNLVEGLIDHQILGIDHVRDMPVHVPLYDWLFPGLGGSGPDSAWLAPLARRAEPFREGAKICPCGAISAISGRLSERPLCID